MSKTLQLNLLKRLLFKPEKRSLWQWVDDIFNRLDDDRIKEVGPNMACAEWLMKNGAQIRWKGCEEFVNHYNCLPIKSRGQQFQIEEVYAGRESSISSIGFPFFTGCKNISEVAFVGCHTINDEALSKLKILKDNLTTLKINGCMNVTDKGILTLEHLQALKYLELKNLQFLKNPETIDTIKEKLPECDVLYEPNE
ncbi:Hypothetical protein CINCED_3A003958 [Cinara cedri]|uniref:Uncharacterized protein n=2 Tax=Cinara cedri TaxID=506608 RepID=A0A5E4M6E4_9HEMI|nr:Hypothetical protein CINCED_3A003958 [Cinara cedri]